MAYKDSFLRSKHMPGPLQMKGEFVYLISPFSDDGSIATVKAPPCTRLFLDSVLQHARIVDGRQVDNVDQWAHP